MQKYTALENEIEGYKRSRKIKWWDINAILLLAIFLTFHLWSYYISYKLAEVRELEAKTKAMQQVQEQQEIEKAQNQILDCLAFLESTNNPNLKVLDTNNKYSLGLYQFQVATIKDILLKYENLTVSTHEAIRIAYSPELSRELSYKSIFAFGLRSKWLNSFEKMKNGTSGCYFTNPQYITKL